MSTPRSAGETEEGLDFDREEGDPESISASMTRGAPNTQSARALTITSLDSPPSTAPRDTSARAAGHANREAHRGQMILFASVVTPCVAANNGSRSSGKVAGADEFARGSSDARVSRDEVREARAMRGSAKRSECARGSSEVKGDDGGRDDLSELLFSCAAYVIKPMSARMT